MQKTVGNKELLTKKEGQSCSKECGTEWHLGLQATAQDAVVIKLTWKKITGKIYTLPVEIVVELVCEDCQKQNRQGDLLCLGCGIWQSGFLLETTARDAVVSISM